MNNSVGKTLMVIIERGCLLPSILDQVTSEGEICIVLVLAIVVADENQCPRFGSRATTGLERLDRTVHHRTEPIPALLEFSLQCVHVRQLPARMVAHQPWDKVDPTKQQ